MKNPRKFLIIATHNNSSKGIVEANRKPLAKWVDNFQSGEEEGNQFRKIEIYAKTPDGIYMQIDEYNHTRVGF